jgi:hypothetical protein
MTFSSVTRWVRGYDRHTERLLAEYPVPSSWTLERLQELCGLPEDPLFGSFPLADRHLRELGIARTLGNSDLDYFLEADAIV